VAVADLVQALDGAFEWAKGVVGGVEPNQLDGPTPCPEWDLRRLLRHMTGVVATMGRGAAGEGLLSSPNDYELADDVGPQFSAEADRTLAAWRARGLEGQVDVGAGPMPAAAAISVNLVDTSTHAWDVAVASGQPADLPEDLAATVLGVAEGFVGPELRQAVGIGDPVPVGDDASPTDRLVAFMGRQPR
jgi:uncharacterized protein (TIGR03086 family)